MIGRPLLGDPMMNLDRYDAVLGIAEAYHVPVVMDCDIGHIDPMMPLISGGFGTLRPCGAHNIQIDYQLI